MKKVLLISPQPFFQWRGSPIRVGFNVMALVKAGYQVDLLTLPIGEKREIDGVRIIRVANPFRLANIPIGPSLPKIFFDLLLVLKGMGLVRKNNYEVIHGIEEAGMIAVLLSRVAGCRAIFEKHSDPFSYKKGFLKNCLLRVYAGVERATVRRVDAVIGTGPGLVRQVQEMGSRVKVFHIFDIPSSLVDPKPENIARIREKIQQQNDEVLITFVGSFAVYQGVDLLFEAVPEIIRTCPQARIVIIGGTEEEIKQRRQVLEQQGMVSQVSFLGKIAPDILPDYLAASDILLSPRISGVNTPLKLLDYLKAGQAIVATDVEANRLILDNDIAVLAPPNPSALAQAIVSLVNDPEKRREMGKRGRVLYEQRYNFTQYTKRLAACYAHVTGENRQGETNAAGD